MTPAPFVSVVIPTFNRRASLEACVDSILRVDYPAFELIVCDDGSTDGTFAMLAQRAAGDPRLRPVRAPANGGPAMARNLAIREAQGEIVFFADDDVVVAPDWLTAGVARFDDGSLVGIEGRIVYVSESYRPRYGDRVVENPTGGQYMTANAAYRREPLVEAGLFDESLSRYEDMELAFRMAKRGRIAFAPTCVVFHQRETYTPRAFFAEARHIEQLLPVMKRTGDRRRLVGRVFLPEKLVALVLPPVVLLRLSARRVASVNDWICLLLAYPRLVYERLILWRTAVAERFFVV
jgi:glycosyltransferase involved in cell wall biosynthesis